MIQENNIVIAQNKSKDFIEFIKRSGKQKKFWKENERVASTQIDESELDKLFRDDQ